MIIKKLYFILNAYLALIIYIFSNKKKDIWLVGGHNGRLYTDNSKVFYEYILKNHSEIDIYWVVDKNAPALNQIKGKKVIKGSILNYLYFYRSRVVLFSDTLNSDIAPFSFILPFINIYYKKNFKVYLGHGTISFKKMPKFKGIKQYIKDKIFNSYNLAIASTKLEAEVMVKSYGIKKSAIALVGKARNDELANKKSEKKTILVAPTWRVWLKDKSSLKDTNFYHNYKEFLTNKKLLSYLKKHNIVIKFYLHHMFHKFIYEFEVFKNENIDILKPQANISEEISIALMLITDYSSICADFYFLRKSVLFFHFDKDEYNRKIGSYINLDSSFGNVTYNPKDLVTSTINFIEEKYPLTSKQKDGEKYFISFTDKKNCERIYNTILNKIMV